MQSKWLKLPILLLIGYDAATPKMFGPIEIFIREYTNFFKTGDSLGNQISFCNSNRIKTMFEYICEWLSHTQFFMINSCYSDDR